MNIRYLVAAYAIAVAVPAFAQHHHGGHSGHGSHIGHGSHLGHGGIHLGHGGHSNHGIHLGHGSHLGHGVHLGIGHGSHLHGGIVGGHIDHHNHIVQDSHGHVVGTTHHDVVHTGWSHVVPTIHGHGHGQYYVQGDQHYFAPIAPVSSSGTYVAAKPALVPYGGFNQTDDLSGRLETLANELLLDLHHNYQHNPGFAETYREAYQLLDAAKFIHAADHNNDRDAIRSRINGTDQLFHHIQQDVRGWSRIHQRQIGSLGILSKMELVEATLHHLMNDVGVSPSGGPDSAPMAPPILEQAPPPPAVDAQLGNTPPPPTIQ
ncbi:hypothetical protein NZK35_06595 [Stieleria sp. ICT_E10.1]|uniref:Uncharacterized protein n=1 Tax=Stieleria magnilauensis TaxID=2527963 RepID=A0ABX5XU56_9BACT|nr:hypothetical protein [Stieleria sedimenti]MCS7466343.1 hypothetical protein [Stieleria sedimenti]QDV85331.1 hypothetical protein TBK1r_43100 [Planctomycetes bacterium TBK1r]